jgi:glutamyl-tRNA synthetase
MTTIMTVVTRFAPSPTGYLHIGGARTALFNYLFAKHHNGKFLLRVEDTDRERSTKEAEQAILEGLKWLGLNWDGEPYFQHKHEARHKEVAEELVKRGQAYYCYCTPQELAELREKKLPYDRRWRDKDGKDAPTGVKPAVRLKSPLDRDVVVKDHIRGEVRVPAGQLEDLVILRSDGTPTYNLAVVVDDHDMGVTHVIRGEDHLTNAAKQQVMYEAMGWTVPEFAHIPLIHGPDGAKMSKRHGAVGVEAYRDMGYLPEALRNYLLRLGWAHGDDETISDAQAIEWFSLEGVGQSPSRFDFAKLDNLNGHYIREAEDARLVDMIVDGRRWTVNGTSSSVIRHPSAEERKLLIRAMPGLKARAKTLKELAENAAFYTTPRPLAMDTKAKDILDKGGRDVIKALLPKLEAQTDFSHAATMELCKAYAESAGKKLGDIAQPLRAALSGKTVSPGVFEVMEILGKEESLGRLKDVC